MPRRTAVPIPDFNPLEIDGPALNLPPPTVNHSKPNAIKVEAKLRRAHAKLKKNFMLELATRLSKVGNRNERMGKENIVGISIGEKKRQGRFTGEPCVVFLVNSKLHVDLLEIEAVIPSHIDGIATDVEVCRAVYPLMAVPRKRLQPGECVRNSQGEEGTLGCLVARGSDLCLLSNNHVLALLNRGQRRDLAANPPQQGDVIDYVADQDYPIGYLFDYIDLNLNQGENLADCAIAAVDCHWVWPTPVRVVEISAQTQQPFHGQSVQKSGRNGFTTGTVDMLNKTIDVTYDIGGTARLVNQFSIIGSDGDFATGGDSGSLVMEQGTNRPVGLVVANTPAFTIATPIDAVLKALNVNLVTQLPSGCF
jgi:hypothetical protein